MFLLHYSEYLVFFYTCMLFAISACDNKSEV